MSAPPPAAESWTTRRLLAWMVEAFTKAGLESPRLQAEMLLGHVIGCARLRLFMEPERAASDQERMRLRDLVARALRHEPIDYLVGERSFFGLVFGVDRRVLVPRPSSETIVEFVLQEARRAMQNAEGAEGDAAGAEGGRGAGNGARGDGTPGPTGPAESRSFEPDAPSRARSRPGEVVFDLHDRETSSALSAFKPTADELEEDDDESSLDRPREPRLREVAGESGSGPRTDAASQANRRGTPVEKRRREGSPAWRIADVCTGSGCIAIALAHHLPHARVLATDISEDALAVARENARRHRVDQRVRFERGDLLAPLTPHAPVDVIVANPPYIPDDEWDAVAPNVKDHEPTIALRGGPDGLRLVRPLIEGAPSLLRPGGLLLIELATSRAEGASAMARSQPLLEGVQILRDVDGLERVLVTRRR